MPQPISGKASAKNLPVNHAWWTFQVCATQVTEVPERGTDTEFERFYGFKDDDGNMRWVKLLLLTLLGPPDHLMEKHLHKKVTSFSELRQAYFSFQPADWITYHSYTIIEVGDGDLFLAMEKKTTRLEFMFCEGQLCRAILKDFRAAGAVRDLKKCTELPKEEVSDGPTLREVLDWVDGPCAEHWQPYDMMRSNCQMFVSDLQSFLRSPSRADFPRIPPGADASSEEAIAMVRADSRSLQTASEELRNDKNFLFAVLRPNWSALRHAPLHMRGDPEVALCAVCQNGYALQYVTEELRRNKEFVLQAVAIDGHALCYVAGSLRRDPQVVLTAIRQNGYALQYSEDLRTKRDFILEAVKVNAHSLAICGQEIRKDREVVLAAVRQNGYALQYVAGSLQSDMEVIAAAVWQTPQALKYVLA
jgi:hypothetical protein